jgi:hypothetical protein
LFAALSKRDSFRLNINIDLSELILLISCVMLPRSSKDARI